MEGAEEGGEGGEGGGGGKLLRTGWEGANGWTGIEGSLRGPRGFKNITRCTLYNFACINIL